MEGDLQLGDISKAESGAGRIAGGSLLCGSMREAGQGGESSALERKEHSPPWGCRLGTHENTLGVRTAAAGEWVMVEAPKQS